ncbi:MAG: DNA repair protein RecN [Xanthobacteraceae bacterium]|nr:DNA repair protein RecN [Xanthobacteraceae bacterium]QYK44291.1 MAG: DNA repair protein RecN [Xanthobacteraceae bacterium]
MLSRLSISDIVLIDRLDVDFRNGLSVLTGETGAGKSIVLDAFTLALGARGDAALVRDGAEQGQVVAAFDLPKKHPARELLRANDLGDDDGEVILRRVQLADGRTRAFINDRPVSVQILRELGTKLVEIHGQHDERALVDPAVHRAVLDAFGGNAELAAKTRALWQAWREQEALVAAERERNERAKRDADYIRNAVDELTKLAPQPGEETTLAGRRASLMRAEKVAGDLKDAHDVIAGSGSSVPEIASALRRLERRQQEAADIVGGPAKALETALNSIEEARLGLEAAMRLADYDPQELERNEERLFALRAAGRKYGSAVDDLPAVAARFEGDLAAIDQGDANLKKLEAAAQQAEREFRETAKKLSEARAATAKKLDKAVQAELPPLKLERAEFISEIESNPSSPGPDGYDRVEFWVRTNPGARPGPMMKVASGGELARFLLALKVVLADRGSAPTLVFDEIDTGVGGAVSDAIGARLARLAQKVQVLTVTHAPQVAARAVNHFLVAKEAVQGGKRVNTKIATLDDKKRREEVARMLSGADVTDEARKAAERLIAGAAA